MFLKFVDSLIFKLYVASASVRVASSTIPIKMSFGNVHIRKEACDNRRYSIPKGYLQKKPITNAVNHQCPRPKRGVSWQPSVL